MLAQAVKAELKAIQSLRALYLQENNSQIRYSAVHERGWTDSYLLTLDGLEVGYAPFHRFRVSDGSTGRRCCFACSSSTFSAARAVAAECA